MLFFPYFGSEFSYNLDLSLKKGLCIVDFYYILYLKVYIKKKIELFIILIVKHKEEWVGVWGGGYYF